MYLLIYCDKLQLTCNFDKLQVNLHLKHAFTYLDQPLNT